MNQKNANQHLVDVLFVLSLFAVFVLCGLCLIIMGTHLYEKNVNEMNHNYSARTSYCYFTEKIRQSDYQSTVEVNEMDGKSILCIHQSFVNSEYTTYLYEDDGYLKELFTRSENAFSFQDGTPILKLSHLVIEKENEHLLKIQFRDEDFSLISFYVHMVSE